MNKRKNSNKNIAVKVIAGIIALITGFLFLMVILLRTSPSTGAYGADFLRKLLGNQLVAGLETVLFKTEDTIKSIEFKLGLNVASNPWEIPQLSGLPSNDGSYLTGNSGSLSQQNPGNGSGVNLLPSDNWIPSSINQAGPANGAGVWIPYIQNTDGKVIAYKTFVQPDPERPYALTAIVAFNLNRSRLNFVIGTDEPYGKNVEKRAPGKIPETDMSPGSLIATFNGGFKYEHGHFGASSNGFVSALPLSGIGTVAMFRDGSIKMGMWGSDIVPSSDLLAYRQNGPMVIRDGIISDKINNQNLWGLTIDGGVVTWRSGLALSENGKTLYYFAGSYLTINTLAKAMKMVLAQNAIQLDINNFWVHFDAIRSRNGDLVAEPLFPGDMSSDPTRYLKKFSRDFFYVTAINK
jgi:hypothetical protein